jgi:predicted aspartyl protease
MRSIPKLIVFVMSVNGHPVPALVDTGSLADFMSTTLADQLKVEKGQLEKPLLVQLAVQGS